MKLRSTALAAALTLTATLAPAIARAQVSDGDKAAARQLTIEGLGALEKKDFALAADLFTRADKLIHAPTVTLGLARADVGLGKLLAAFELYNRLVHEPLPPNPSEAFTRSMDEGRAELAALTPRIPSLIIQVKGANDPKVTLDGADVPSAVVGIKRPVDLGKHLVRAVAKGMLPAEATITIGEGKVETVTLELKAAPPGTPDAPELAGAPAVVGPGAPPPTPPPEQGGQWRKPTGFALLGVGGAGLVVGAVTAGLAASKRSSLIQQCPTGHCPASLQPTLQSSVDAMHTDAAVSTAGFVAGGVLAAGGLILVLTAPKAQTTGSGWVMPLIGPGFAGAQGRF
jgi:hypothetical protein